MATPSRSDPVPQAKHQHLVHKYNELYQNYRRLEKDHNSRKEELEKLKENFEKAQRELSIAHDRDRQWKLWIDRHPVGILTQETSREEELPLPTAGVHDARDEQRASERVGSSQTTESEGIDLPDVQAEPSSDDVEVISTRFVKGRRNAAMKPPPTRVKQEQNSPHDPIELASEGFSSPPLPQKSPMRAETSDLDALLSNVRTPRKRRRLRAVSVELEAPRLMHMKSSLSDGDEAESRMAIIPAWEGNNSLDGVSTHAVHGSSHGSDKDVLRQLDPNVLLNSTSTSRNSVATRKRGHDEMREKVAILSEDGDMGSSQVVTPVISHTSKRHRDQRLDTLFLGPTPDREPLSKRRTPETVIRRPANPIISEPPRHSRSRLPASNSPHKFKYPRSRLHSPPPPTPNPDNEPLRSRPIASLSLNDFKINPAYQSTDYAFADTIRGREQRRCLPGCTKPTCCGGVFLRAAQTGALTPSKPDPELLEDYLGPTWRDVLGTMSKAKREETRVQARAFALAAEHGKHRHAFTRAASPPGYWRTDMPNTQEAAADRERAALFVREKVEERWREALRSGGRWVFRDE